MIKYYNEPDFFNYLTEFKGQVNLGNINITGGTITGITDLAIADGGTGASTALGAVQNLLNNTALTTVSAATGDKLLIQDVSDANNVKTTLVSDIITLATMSDEAIQDIVGAMVTGNTETLITVTYDDPGGKLNFVVNESSINHNALTNYVANQHIDWTSTTSNFSTSGTAATGALSVTGNITVTGNVDGRDVSADGTTIDNLKAPQYVTLATNSTLTNERVLTAGNGVTLTDAGAGSTLTIAGKNANGFKVYRNGLQALSATTHTLIQLDTEVFDTDGTFDTSTYRHTPTVAGKYLYLVRMLFQSLTDQEVMSPTIWKNGSVAEGGVIKASGTGAQYCQFFTMQDMNGSSDYVELKGYRTYAGDVGDASLPAVSLWLSSIYMGV